MTYEQDTRDTPPDGATTLEKLDWQLQHYEFDSPGVVVGLRPAARAVWLRQRTGVLSELSGGYPQLLEESDQGSLLLAALLEIAVRALRDPNAMTRDRLEVAYAAEEAIRDAVSRHQFSKALYGRWHEFSQLSREAYAEAERAAAPGPTEPDLVGDLPSEATHVSSLGQADRNAIIGKLVSAQSKIRPHEEGYGFGVVAIAVPAFGLPVAFLTLVAAPDIPAAMGIIVWLLSGAVITAILSERDKAPSAARFRKELEKSSDARLADLYCGYLHPDGNPDLWEVADRVRRGLA